MSRINPLQSEKDDVTRRVSQDDILFPSPRNIGFPLIKGGSALDARRSLSGESALTVFAYTGHCLTGATNRVSAKGSDYDVPGRMTNLL